MSEPVRTYLASPSPTRLRLPALACDAHVHVFGPAARFAFASTSALQPVDAPKEALFALHRQMGIARCVIVQSTVHGLDNRVVEDAIAAGDKRYLGVALVAADAADSELERLAGAGFRGVRFNFMKHLRGGATPEQVLALTPRLAAFSLHLQVHFESALVHSLAPLLVKSAVPVMIDHMGRVDARQGVQGEDFQALCALLRHPRMHVKISGIDRVDASVPLQEPPYEHGVLLARHLLREFPERCVWGSDWPHPNHTHIPDDGVLVDALARIAPESTDLQRLLVDNPAAFYRFDAP